MQKNNKGFTLAEILVVVGVMAVAGVVVTQIFLSSVRGGNKAQILDAMKQNGQIALDLMDKTIKNSDNVVCVTTDTIVVDTNKVYTRYRFTGPQGSANGKITQENLIVPADNPPGTVANFFATVCDNTQTFFPLNITDTNTKTGASIILPANGPVFSKNTQAGFTDVVSIQFNVGPGVDTPFSVSSTIDPIPFSTTIVLRNSKI